MFRINHYKGRTRDYDIQLFEADGTTEVILAAEDEVYFVAVDCQGNIVLQADSIADQDGGSNCTFTAGTNNVTLLIGQEDCDDGAIDEGVVFDCEVTVIDDSQNIGTPAAKKIKHVEAGNLVLHPSRGGALTDEQSSDSS